jgi:isoleucyl-tRNA synthetase
VAKDYTFPAEYADIIRDEVNVKDVRSSNAFDDFASLKLQVNFPKIGARLGNKTKEVIAAVKKGEWKQDGDIIKVAGETLIAGEFDLQLEAKPAFAQSASPLSSNDALAVLDTNVTQELENEGIARDMVRAIQQARKDAGLNVSDRIALTLVVPENVASAVRAHENYIVDQTLAISLSFSAAATEGAFVAESTIDEQKVSVALIRAA